MLLWIPGLDMLRVFVLRIRKKRNPFYPDQNHFHHILKKIYNKKFLLPCLLFYITNSFKYYSHKISTTQSLNFNFNYSSIFYNYIFLENIIKLKICN